LLPAQDQFHGPLPVTAETVPVVQSPVLGAVLAALPLAVPQEPFTAEEAAGAEQLAVVPPLLPAQDQFHGPLPVTAEAAPVVQSPVLGAVLTALLAAAPQEPFTGEAATAAEQLAVVPPLLPAQDQFHGPLPLTAEAVPIVQSPVLGAVLTALPLAVPQEPFTAEEATEAEQLAVVPPLLPAQDQFHGPLPVTVETVPVVQSPVVGLVLTALPLAVPHEPFTAATEAEQLAVVPPLLPAQDQFHGPLPVTPEAVPTLQSPVVGALLTAVPLAVPHEPFIAEEATGAEHLAIDSWPKHLHCHGPVPSTRVAHPALHRLVVGALLVGTPFAEPHVPAHAGVARNEKKNATPKMVLTMRSNLLGALRSDAGYSSAISAAG